ncbi:alkaline phosphatase [Paraphysoderma sedebokerense]|nr:alkaline phosphatase [Paraphysoderma sedebokerense]
MSHSTPERAAPASQSTVSTPLLGNSNDDLLDELENGGVPQSKNRFRKKIRAFMLIGAVGFIAVLLIIGIAVGIQKLNTRGKPKRNVILMISDGFGPASETFARSYYQYVNNMTVSYMTPLDEILVGASRTRSSSSLVTDSAAGATAFSCVLKTYNGAIGVDPDKKACGTVLEAAKSKGYYTGLVATSRITHATPASFNAHVVHRDYENDIAEQQIGDHPLSRTTDLMFGGGRRHFLPTGRNESVRTDSRDLLKEATDRGLNVLVDRNGFDKVTVKPQILPILGLFTADHMSYEIDRDPSKEPSLKEMASKALDLLYTATMGDEKSPGFFVMIEGSRIDMAAHSNDPATHVHEILMYHQTVALVKEWVSKHEDTVMISVSDHETGGFSLARQLNESYPEYLWYPAALTRIRNSTVVLAASISKFKGQADEKEKFVRTLVKENLGLDDATDDEVKYLTSVKSTGQLDYFLGGMVSKRAQLGWATHGHSGVDVNLYAYGTNAHELAGNHENTDIGLFISKFLELDVNEVTTKLRKTNFIKRPDLPSGGDKLMFKLNGHGHEYLH